MGPVMCGQIPAAVYVSIAVYESRYYSKYSHGDTEPDMPGPDLAGGSRGQWRRRLARNQVAAFAARGGPRPRSRHIHRRRREGPRLPRGPHGAHESRRLCRRMLHRSGCFHHAPHIFRTSLLTREVAWMAAGRSPSGFSGVPRVPGACGCARGGQQQCWRLVTSATGGSW